MTLLYDIGIADIAKYADSLGAVAILILILVGGKRKWWVFGWQYSDVERERNEWRQLALRGTTLAESLTTVTEKRLFTDGNT